MKEQKQSDFILQKLSITVKQKGHSGIEPVCPFYYLIAKRMINYQDSVPKLG